MKTPGPDHPITITANPRRVRVLFEDHLLADTPAALTLQESTYPAVQYIPRDDAAMLYLVKTSHSTHCPYKGDASYYTIHRDGVIAENAVWSYEDPYPAMTAIKGHLAFYPNKVVLEEGELVATADMRDVVEHTDSGSGASQLDHWAPNADGPPNDIPVVERPYKDTGAI